MHVHQHGNYWLPLLSRECCVASDISMMPSDIPVVSDGKRMNCGARSIVDMEQHCRTNGRHYQRDEQEQRTHDSVTQKHVYPLAHTCSVSTRLVP